jgi:pilus assembly protein CpaC
MPRSIRLLISLLAMILAALPATAQGPASEPPLPLAAPQAKVVVVGQPRGAAQAVHGDGLGRGGPVLGEPLRVAVNKSVEMHLPAEARDIIIGNPEVADVVVRSPTLVFVVGRGSGQTNVYFRDGNGRTIGHLEIDVHIDTDALRDMLRQTLPEENNIHVSAVGDSIVLSGSVRNDASASTARMMVRRFVRDDGNLVNLLKVATDQQVLLHVKIAEMQKTVLKELGVTTTLSGAQRLGNHSVLSTAGAGAQTTNATATVASSGAAVTTSTPTVSTSTLVLGSLPYANMSVTGIGALASNFTLLEQHGLMKTLDEPMLTAVSGETATMLAGGEVPIPIPGDAGSMSVTYHQFGIQLAFTPVALDAGRVSLKMQTEVSSVDSTLQVAVGQNISVPGFRVRRAASVVELPSGGSIMIAGLLQNDVNSSVAGLPGLMNVPVLGALFRSHSFQRSESELVVVVSAYMVQPVDAQKISTPTDGFAPSSDLDRFLLGRLQDIYATSRTPPPAPAQLQGPYGYIVQ